MRALHRFIGDHKGLQEITSGYTVVYKGLQGITEHYNGLYGITTGYRGSQGMKGGYTGLEGIEEFTGDYKWLQRISYRRLQGVIGLQGITKLYRGSQWVTGLQGITKLFRGSQRVTGDYKGLQRITRVYWHYKSIKWIRIVYTVLQGFAKDYKGLRGLQGYKGD